MTFFHILNFALPIASFVLIGFGLDRMCKPEESKAKLKKVK